MTENLLVNLLDQENSRVIHYQEERANSTNILFVFGGAIIGLILFDQHVNNTVDLILSIMLIFLGILGVMLNAKYHDRVYHHELRRKFLFQELDIQLQNKITERAENFAKAEINKTWHGRVIRKFTLWKLWVTANSGLILVGIVLIFVRFYFPI